MSYISTSSQSYFLRTVGTYVSLPRLYFFDFLLFYTDIQIWPKGPDYILKPESHEDNRTFMCSGNEAVKWYFEKFDKSLVAMLVRIFQKN